MGALPSIIRAEARKQTDEIEKTTNDALNSLVDLAKVQIALLKVQVNLVSECSYGLAVS